MMLWEHIKGELVKYGHQEKTCLMSEPKCKGFLAVN